MLSDILIWLPQWHRFVCICVPYLLEIDSLTVTVESDLNAARLFSLFSCEFDRILAYHLVL